MIDDIGLGLVGSTPTESKLQQPWEQIGSTPTESKLQVLQT